MSSGGFKVTLNGQPVHSNSSSQNRNVERAQTTKLTKKEYTAFPVADCPSRAFPAFTGSQCRHSPARSWLKYCQADTNLERRVILPGICPPLHRCYTRPPEGLIDIPIAWCVNIHAVVQTWLMRMTWSDMDSMLHQLTMTPQNTNQDNNLGLFLTEQRNDNPRVDASSITLAAKDKDNNILGQVVSCDNCNELSYLDWPASTTHIDSNITLPNSNQGVIANIVGWTI